MLETTSRKILRPVRAALFAAFLPALAHAHALSWPACVEQVRQNSPELRAAERTRNSVYEQEGVARAGYLPQVTGTLSYSKNNSAVNGVAGVQPSGTFTGSLQATQNLFNGLQDLGKLTQAKANTRAADAQLAITKAKISYDLKNAYENLVYANNLLKLTADIIRRRQENLRLVELRFNSGRENRGSVLLSHAYLKQAELDDLQARHNQRIAQAQLARTLGFDDYEAVTIEGEIPVHAPVEHGVNLSKISESVPDYIQAKSQAEAADAGVGVARGTFLPSLNVTGTVGEQGQNFWPNERDTWSLGVNLSYPLFNGGKDYHSLRAASETYAASEATRINTLRQITAKLEQMLASFSEAVVKLEVDAGFREAAGERAEIARKKYNNGLLTFDDWDLIENDLITRQKAYLQSKRDRVVAEAAWDQALGQGVIP